MPLDDLVSVIETLQQRIATHRQSLQQNETRTRTALIDPLLTALGWDVSDPALVTPEYNVGNGRADYALNGSESIPSAMVEAKRLGHALSDDERMQMLNYANARGVRHAVVTDGNVWELYEVFKQAPLEDRRLLNLRIANTPAHELVLRLLLLWRPNLASGQPMAANEPVVGLISVPLPETPAMSESSLATEVPPPISPEPALAESGWVSLAEFNPPNGSKAPKSIRFPDGDRRTIHGMADILVAVATWLYDTGQLTVENLPVRSGPKRYIVSNEPIHPTGNEFTAYRVVANRLLVVNTHDNSTQIRKNTRSLLQHCDVSPDTVQLQVGQ